MIFAFKNTNPGIVQCDFIDILSDYSMIKNIYIVSSEFFFANDEEARDQNNWYNEIQLNNIIPIYGSKDTENNNESPVRNTGIQDIEIEITKGKYKFTHYFNYDVSLYKKLLNIDNIPVYVYFQDINNNIYGKLDGTDIFGIRCELFSVEKLEFGTKELSGLKIYTSINASEIDDISITQDVEFNGLDLIYYDVLSYVITDAQSTAANITDVTVEGSGGLPATGLLEAVFSITDDLNGAMTIDYFSEISPGVYRIRVTGILTSGYIYITTEAVSSYNYDFRSLQLLYHETFTAFYDTVNNSFDQRLPAAWSFTIADPLSVTVQDYNVNEIGVNENVVCTVFAGTGVQTWMTNLNVSFFPDNTNYITEVTYKRNIIGVNNMDVRYWSLGGGSSSSFQIQNTAGLFEKAYITNPVGDIIGIFSMFFQIGFIGVTPLANDFYVEISDIKMYKEL